MTEERAKKILEAIEAYDDKEALYAMSPEDATAALNATGNNFTVEEITEAGEGLKAVAQVTSANGEIDLAALEQVSGGANSKSAFWGGVAVGSGIGAGVCFAGAAICACLW